MAEKAAKTAKRTARESSPIRVVGVRKHPVRDIYHGALRLPWAQTVLAIASAFIVLNALFAIVYFVVGGVAHARPHSLADSFFFSVQTMGTIGYGAMYPESTAANIVVVAETVVSMLVTAVATGLVFAKFSRSTARIVFAARAVIAKMDGVPTLMFRVGNDRESVIAEATVRVVIVRTEITLEGRTFYRLYDLPLVRERSLALARSWTVMHRIDEKSPLFGATAESLVKDEVEIMTTVAGTDDTSLQPVHARHTYYHDEIAWNAHYADVLTDNGDEMIMDLRRFHEIIEDGA
jgi:inward rectifier potassium channel